MAHRSLGSRPSQRRLDRAQLQGGRNLRGRRRSLVDGRVLDRRVPGTHDGHGVVSRRDRRSFRRRRSRQHLLRQGHLEWSRLRRRLGNRVAARGSQTCPERLDGDRAKRRWRDPEREGRRRLQQRIRRRHRDPVVSAPCRELREQPGAVSGQPNRNRWRDRTGRPGERGAVTGHAPLFSTEPNAGLLFSCSPTARIRHRWAGRASC